MYTLSDLMPDDEVTILANGSSKVDLPDRPVNLWCQGFMIHFLRLRGLEPDVWVDIHRDETWTEPKPWNPDYLEFLAGARQPVLMWDQHVQIPSSVAMPEEMKWKGYTGNNRYTSYVQEEDEKWPAPFSGTLDWLVALAVFLNARKINLYGADYVTLHERLHQTFGLAYWLAFARGKGITVCLPPSCRLLWNIVPGRYGPEYPPWPAIHDPRVDFYIQNPLSVLVPKSMDRETNFAKPHIRFVPQPSPAPSAVPEGKQKPFWHDEEPLL